MTGQSISSKIRKFITSREPQTPYLVVDLSVVETKYRQLTNALPYATCFYSVKANPAPAVLALLVKCGSGFETASLNEVKLCLDAGASPANIIFGNTVKRTAEIAEAYKLGVKKYVFDCDGELQKISTAAPGAKVFCRIMTSNSGAVWPLTRKFGCDIHHAVDLMVMAKKRGLEPYGISFHVGSQQREPESWDSAITNSHVIITQLRQKGIFVGSLDIGGGFPAHYRNPVPDIQSYAAFITSSLTQSFEQQWPEIVIEPGRYIVGDAGVIAGEILLIRDDLDGAGRRWISLDVGKFNGLQETEAAQYRIVTDKTDIHHTPVVLAGPTCDSDDIIYEETPCFLPPNLAIGDRIYFLSTGAYTRPYATIGFNGFEPLDEYYI